MGSQVRTARLLLRAVEGSILALLEQHGSLGYEQIAAHLGEPPDAVRNALTGLRERGLIDVLSVGGITGSADDCRLLLATERRWPR
jgi:predicted ArsR family transcriptional regulator